MSHIYDRIYGIIAATRTASAMGAAVEGWTTKAIIDKFGVLEHFEPFHHYKERTQWVHPAGCTEDGIERQKLMCTAIIEKVDPGKPIVVWNDCFDAFHNAAKAAEDGCAAARAGEMTAENGNGSGAREDHKGIFIEMRDGMPDGFGVEFNDADHRNFDDRGSQSPQAS